MDPDSKARLQLGSFPIKNRFSSFRSRGKRWHKEVIRSLEIGGAGMSYAHHSSARAFGSLLENPHAESSEMCGPAVQARLRPHSLNRNTPKSWSQRCPVSRGRRCTTVLILCLMLETPRCCSFTCSPLFLVALHHVLLPPFPAAPFVRARLNTRVGVPVSGQNSRLLAVQPSTSYHLDTVVALTSWEKHGPGKRTTVALET